MAALHDLASSAQALTARQVEVFVIVTRYYDILGEACPAQHVARRLKIHHEAVRGHFERLCRKGWLESKNSPAIPLLRRLRYLAPS